MKAMPLSGGILEKKSSNAFNPPAEAPIPTMGNPVFLCSSGGVRCWRETILERFLGAKRARLFFFEAIHSPT
jgi:hypothetical protein